MKNQTPNFARANDSARDCGLTQVLREDPRVPQAVRRVHDYVDANLRESISLRDVAKSLSYSAAYLTTTFREHTGRSVTAWIIEQRIHTAAEELRRSDLPVSAICEAAGFNDVCYFSRQFLRHTGLTPGRFRRAYRAS